MKFIIMNSGDSDVGLRGFDIEIEVKDKDGVLDDEKEEFIEYMKKSLKEAFSHHDGRTTIMTQEELDDMIDLEVQKEELKAEGN